MTFCTAINCMDGRTQLPVNQYLVRRFGAEFVDTVTEPGPNRVLAEREIDRTVAGVIARVDISVGRHGSKGIAVVGHHDCAGNPADETAQADHTRRAVAFLRRKYPDVEVIGLWVDSDWVVHELPVEEG